MESGFHEWACFAVHQAAENALKALHLSLNQDAWGHVLARLIADLPDSIAFSESLLDKARVMDNYYIPCRYSNGHSEGAPFKHYGQLQNTEAIRICR